MTKKSQGNQGIQADHIDADVIAVGDNAKAVQTNYYSGGPEHEKLTELFEELKKALAAVPTEASEDAEIVNELATELVEKATNEQPSKRMLEIKGEGLKAAAEALKDVTPTVLAIATQIVGHILTMAG